MRLLFGGLAALVALVPARPAEACSCAGTPGLMLPAPGSTDVPRDVQIYYRPDAEEGSAPPSGEITLRLGETVVDALVESRYEAQVLTPLASLAVGQEYTLYFEEAVVGTFVVGDKEILAAPAAPQIRSLVYQRAPLLGEPSSCNERGRGHAAIDLAEDADAVAYLATTRDGQALFLPERVRRLVAPEEGSCLWPWPNFSRDGQLCVRLQAVGADGQLSPPSEMCAAPEECAAFPPTGEFICEPPSDGCSVSPGGRGGAAGALLLALTLVGLRRRREV